MFFLLPATQALTLLPVAVEAVLRLLGMARGLPVALLLGLTECAFIIVIYRGLLRWQGNLLQSREQRILETVTSRAP